MPPLPARSGSDDQHPPPEPATGAPVELVEHFFRHEAGRLHGALVRRFGVQHLGLVEDVVQEALLRALRSWAMGGVPPNPSAWISRVAHNLALDALRHRSLAAAREDAVATHFQHHHHDASHAAPAEDNGDSLADDTLRLLFVCCHPAVSADAQVMLALKIVGGFSTIEIARAFLSTEAAVEKQLTRTKQRLRDAAVGFELPAGADLTPRIDGVLATLYLLFNEGYMATSGDSVLREDLCREAERLAGLLVAHPLGDRPAVHALCALMLLHGARFPARTAPGGALLRLADQDRTAWDQRRIDRGLRHLAAAAAGDTLTEYHLQAGIAACHCLATDVAATDWASILAHYDALMTLKPSPVVALNRAVAVANHHGARAGLEALAAITDADRIAAQHLVQAVAGELHWRLGDHAAAANHFRRAFSLARVGPEQDHLARLLAEAESLA